MGAMSVEVTWTSATIANDASYIAGRASCSTREGRTNFGTNSGVLRGLTRSSRWLPHSERRWEA